MVDMHEKSIQSIIDQPLTRLRIDVAAKFRAGSFTASDMQELIQALGTGKGGRPEDAGSVKQEIGKLLDALSTGKAPAAPRLNNPSLQLLWGAALAYVTCNPEIQEGWEGGSLVNSPLWKQLTRGPLATAELAESAYHINAGIRNPQAHLRWGTPGSWFYFQPGDKPEENLINLDFMFTLIAGFGHARSVAMHEIGHSQLTTQYPPSMRAIRTQMEPLVEKQKNGDITDEEYGTLAKLQAEWKLRHDFFNPAEDNCANAYMINVGDIIKVQDYGVSRNHTAASISGLGKLYLNKGELPPEMYAPENEAALKLHTLQQAIGRSFYQRNGLFEDSEEGWQSIGVDKKQISARTIPASEISWPPSDDFRMLHELCSGPGGISELQPNQAERQYGPAHFNRRVEECAAKRMQLVDEIWDLYAAHLVQDNLQQVQQQAEEAAQNGAMIAIGLPFETPQDERNAQHGKGSGKGEEAGDDKGQGGGKSDQGEDGEDKEKGTDKNGSSEEEGEGKEAGSGKPNGEGKDEGQDGEPGEGEAGPGDEGKDDNPDPGISIEELLRLRIQIAQLANKQEPGAGASNAPLTPLPQGNLNEYQKMARDNVAPIREVALAFREIQKKQLELVPQFSDDYQLTPAGNALASYDDSRRTALLQKLGVSGQLHVSDLHHFHSREDVAKPAPIDVVLMIDGSDSMYGPTGHDGISRFKKALQVGTILNEAARMANMQTGEEIFPDINVHLVLWGNRQPYILSKPGDPPEIIGQRIADVMKQRRAWGTSLAPGLRGMVNMLATPVPGIEYAGGSHIFIAGDGDITDDHAAGIAMRQLADHCPLATVDTVIINNPATTTDMQRTVERVNNSAITNKIGMVKGSEQEEIKTQVVDLVMNRMRNMQQVMAVPVAEKAGSFHQASLAMQAR